MNLQLTLKKKWFDMTKSGIKTEDYREINEYWIRRLFSLKQFPEMWSKTDFKILDTHGGSGSIAIACHDFKKHLDICELDKDYFDAAVSRFKQHKRQLKLF